MDERMMSRAGLISCDNVSSGIGGPFGAVITKTGTDEVVAACGNSVTTTNDPTAHAEMNAIRNACATLGTFDLRGHTLYTSCEPCPMCLGGIYWAHIDKVFYSNSKIDAQNIGFDDSFIYDELDKHIVERSVPFIHLECDDAVRGFELWKQTDLKTKY